MVKTMQGRSVRDQLFAYAMEQYGSEPEYLWANDPHSAVLRNAQNRKWYAVFMRVSGKKFGLGSDAPVDVVCAKCDPVLREFLLQKGGYYPAYHLNKRLWITAFLDGSVPLDELFRLLNMSYSLVSERKKTL